MQFHLIFTLKYLDISLISSKDLHLKYLWHYVMGLQYHWFFFNRCDSRNAILMTGHCCSGVMSSQPFLRILTPAADKLTGYHLTVTTRDSCSLPFARLAYIISFLRRLSRWPHTFKKPKRFHMVKKVKKPHASSRTAGCSVVIGTKGEKSLAVYSEIT